MPKEHTLATAAVAVADATPKTPSALITLVRTVLLPLLPTIFQEILKADKAGKTKPVLRQIRAVLDGMDLD